MNILITGASGFVGKRVLKVIESEYPSYKITLLTSKVVEGYDCVLHNNYSITKESFGDRKFDVVIHLGSSTPKGNGNDSAFTYCDNVRTTISLIKCLPNIPKKFIFTSSVSVYEKEGVLINESSMLSTSDEYGLSKILCERILNEWANNNDVILDILRLGVIYGPGEEGYKKITGSFIKTVASGKKIEILSDGSEVRNMVFVDDVARIICNAAISWKDSVVVNVVSNATISVKDLAEKITFLIVQNNDVVIHNKGIGRNDLFDSTKIVEIVGEKVFTSYDAGIEALYIYYKEQGII